jgi:sialate O-acetylesterase
MKILSGLTEGQVLQRLGIRGATVHLVIAEAPAGPVSVTIAGKRGGLKGWKNRAVAKGKGGEVKVTLTGIPAGGPYKLELRVGKTVLRVKSFYVGDVWILAGQSNMEGVGNIEGRAKPDPLVRAFSMRREWRLATDPLHVLGESPDFCHTLKQCSSEQAEAHRRKTTKGVGAGVFFGKEMLKLTKVPQGLICTAHGGTSMQQWNPELKGEGGKSLYGSMLLSVLATGQPVAGLLWYQGESDANDNDAPKYTDRMIKLVAASRADLRQPNLPWVIVQLARVFGGPPPNPWNSIQEQQRLLPGKIKNFETVAAIDLPLDDSIHIGADGYPILASRLAQQADRLACGNKAQKPPPQLVSISQPSHPKHPGASQAPVIAVKFDHVVGGLRSNGEARGFFLHDDGKDVPCIHRMTLEGDTVKLHLGTLPLALMTKASLSYGLGIAPLCTITDGRGYSLPVFGPIKLHKPAAYLPFVTGWRTTAVIPATQPIDKIAHPDVNALGAEVWVHGSDGFINERPRWDKVKKGHCYFASGLELSEPMKIEFLMGYDGPFRLWVDGKPLFCNPNGKNPCLPDESARTLALPAGVHAITVAMDLENEGIGSWGFFLRFRRVDVTAKQIETGDYAKPTYSV